MSEATVETRSGRLLIVDDDAGIRKQLKWAFDDFTAVACGDRASALAAAKASPPAIVLLDLGLPPDADGPAEGLAALSELLSCVPDAKIVVMTGQKERSYAVEAVARGAYDFYAKPLDIDELTLIVRRARSLFELEAEHRALQADAARTDLPGLITGNRRLREVAGQIAKLARTDVSVLIRGESGTGKELLSRGVHLLSRRAKGPFIAINCAAIPENLLESELFGHEKGAFTGAHKTTIGKVEQAHEGTLLLDEIGDLPPALQAKLLRVLQERSIERVGGRRTIAVDFRLVAATNRDLEAAIREGAFREDLYYRIGEAEVTIPPLRERPEDAVLIARRFLESWCREQEVPDPGFSGNALAAITQYPWPGNVRELQSRIKRAVACADGRISARDLDLAIPEEGQELRSLKAARRSAERAAIARAMAAAEGNISEAARLLDVSRPTLYQLLNEHEMR